MVQAALSAMTHVLDLEPSDQVLVLTDEETRECGQAFAQAAEDFGCAVEIFVIPPGVRPLAQLPDGLMTSLEDKTVVINAIVGDAREIPFRLRWIQAVEECGCVRMGHSPGITSEMMTAGPMSVDYGQMQKSADSMAGLLAGAVTLKVSTELGTDLVMDVTDRPFVNDLKATVKDGANLPCGEIFCCPVEDGTTGTLIIDGCFGSAGTVPQPVELLIKNGVVKEVHCEDRAIGFEVRQLMDSDATSNIIAELGIGLNPGARMTSNMLEAEKAYETAHIAFGSNQGMPGGQNASITHIDYLFTRPTITAVLADGTERKVLVGGKPAC
jgi:leucyl aminopeptidase (aminopeptidase T)